MNDDFESDIRTRLGRAAHGVEPRPSSRGVALKRARRRRVVNAAVVTGAAVSIAIAGFVGAAAFVDDGAQRLPAPPAGAPSVVGPTVPPGETEIARGDGEMEVAPGETGEYAWVLSGNAEDGCVTLTAEVRGESASSATCDISHGRIGLEETYVGPFVFAVGSAPGDVRTAELDADGEAGGVDTEGIWPLELFPAPSDFETDRQFFVAIVHREAPVASVTVDPEDPAPMNAMIDVQPHKPDERCWVNEESQGAKDPGENETKSCVSTAEPIRPDQGPESGKGTVVYPGATPGDHNSGVKTAPARKG